jgi:N-acetylneuraminic acid mutarotase
MGISMTRSYALLLVLFFIAAPFVTIIEPVLGSASSWASKAPMNAARSSLGVAVVDGKIYAIGGLTASGYEPNTIGTDYDAKGWIVNTNEEYDPATDTWTFKKPMPTSRYGFAITSYDDKIYCMGGISHVHIPSFNPTTANEVYDPATDTWETKAPMPIPSSGQAGVIGGRIYVISPVSNGTLIQTYDPATDSWTIGTPIAPPPNVPLGLTSVVVDNKIYVMYGFYNRASGSTESRTEIYDPLTDKWISGSPVPSIHWIVAVAATTGVMAPKRIYVFGQNETLLAKPELARFVQIYNPKYDFWTIEFDAPTNRIDFGIAVVNDKLYAIGGYTNHYPVPFSDSNRNVRLSALNEQHTPADYGIPDPSYTPPSDHAAPEIVVASPENRTYYTSNITLTVILDEKGAWMRYKLDGKTVVEIGGNTTITGLSYGSHNLTVYATDAAGNTRVSETIYFTISEEPEIEFFPTVTAASIAAVAIVGVSLLVHFKKRNR